MSIAASLRREKQEVRLPCRATMSREPRVAEEWGDPGTAAAKTTTGITLTANPGFSTLCFIQ